MFLWGCQDRKETHFYIIMSLYSFIRRSCVTFSIKNKQLPKNQQFKTTITTATLIALRCMS